MLSQQAAIAAEEALRFLFEDVRLETRLRRWGGPWTAAWADEPVAEEASHWLTALNLPGISWPREESYLDRIRMKIAPKRASPLLVLLHTRAWELLSPLAP